MFIPLKRYKEIKKSYEETLAMSRGMFDLAKEVHKDNGKLIKLCEQLLNENKALIAENKRLKIDETKDKK